MNKKTTAKSKSKQTARTRKTKAAGITLAEAAAARLAIEVKRGLATAPGAMRAAALTPDQKRKIVHHCIAGCADTVSFTSDQQLCTIRQGIEQCVEACIISAVQRPISVNSTDTEDLLVAFI